MRDRLRYYLQNWDWKFIVAVVALAVGILLARRYL
jgi:hypothetical protein